MASSCMRMKFLHLLGLYIFTNLLTLSEEEGCRSMTAQQNHHSGSLCCDLLLSPVFSVVVFWSGPVGWSSVLLVGLWAGLVYSGLPSPLL